MPQPTQISISAEESLFLDARLKRYVLCLGMVHLICERELDASCNISLFRQLGIVASFIDEQLDELNFEQRNQFVNQFDQLFDSLLVSKNFTNFNELVNAFANTYKIQLFNQSQNLEELHQFISYCSNNGLGDYLKHFGKGIVKCSIEKQKANTTSHIRLILKQEGALVCSLLHNLLKVEHGDNQELARTMRFLVECEQILNLGDDCVDAFEDNRTNIIQIQNVHLHGFLMLGYLLKQITRTFILFPKQLIFYTPTLLAYYLKNK